MNPNTITTLEALCDALNSLAGAAPDYPGDLVAKVIKANGWEDLQDKPFDVCAHQGLKVTMRENPSEWQPLFYITEHDVEEVSAQADETFILIDEACAAWLNAKLAMKQAEIVLDDAIRPYLDECKTVEDYQRLIDRLPKSYPHVRRLYEAIERLSQTPQP